MRTAISIAVITALATIAGCAVIVVPDDGGGNGGVHYSSAFGSSAVQGNGQQTTERRDAAASDGIDINGPMQVEVRVGEAASLQVEGDSNLLPMLRTDATGGMLRIWIDGSIRSANPLRVVYTTPQLRQVNANGSGRLSVSGLNGAPFNLSQNGSRQVQLSGNVSRLDVRVNGSGAVDAAGLQSGSTVASVNGSGRLDLGRLSGDTLNLEVRGSGGASATGNVRGMNVRVYGSGSADLAGLSGQSAELVSYGSGSISAGVSQSLVADASGSGHVTVYGNPSQRSISGKHVSVMQ